MLELDGDRARDARDETDPGLVELLDAVHHVHGVLRPGSERLDDVEPRSPGAPPPGAGLASSIDMVERVPCQVARHGRVAVEHGAVEVAEPVEEHRRRHARQRLVVER